MIVSRRKIRGRRTWLVLKRVRSWTTTCEEGRQGRRHQGQEAHQDLVAPLHDPARVHRSDDRRAQRQAARAGLRDRPDGRPQARRICADPHLQGPPADKKAEEVRMTMETKAVVRGVRLSVDKGPPGGDMIRGKKVDQALNILTFTPRRRRHHQEGAGVGHRQRRAQRRRRHRRAEGHLDLRRARAPR